MEEDKVADIVANMEEDKVANMHGGRHGGSELVVVLTMVQVEVAAEVMDVIEVVADTQVH